MLTLIFFALLYANMDSDDKRRVFTDAQEACLQQVYSEFGPHVIRHWALKRLQDRYYRDYPVNDQDFVHHGEEWQQGLPLNAVQASRKTEWYAARNAVSNP